MQEGGSGSRTGGRGGRESRKEVCLPLWSSPWVFGNQIPAYKILKAGNIKKKKKTQQNKSKQTKNLRLAGICSQPAWPKKRIIRPATKTFKSMVGLK